MDQLISCQSLPKSALIPSASWDLHPFLSDTSPTFQTSESIGRIGLLYVPIVRSISNETYEFITGKRCVNSLHDHSSGNEIFCRVLSKDLPVKQLLAILYEEHLAFGKLSPIELAYFLELCRTHLAKVDESSLYTSLGLPEKQHFANRLLELISLELPLQHGLMEGTITESLARDLLKIHKADRLATYSLFTQLKLGGGKQKRLFSLLRDLSGRSGISIDQYMQQAPLQDIIDHPEMNTPQKHSH